MQRSRTKERREQKSLMHFRSKIIIVPVCPFPVAKQNRFDSSLLPTTKFGDLNADSSLASTVRVLSFVCSTRTSFVMPWKLQWIFSNNGELMMWFNRIIWYDFFFSFSLSLSLNMRDEWKKQMSYWVGSLLSWRMKIMDCSSEILNRQ